MKTQRAVKPRAILAHSYWGRGGAEVAAMWTIDALSRDFDVTVYTRGGFDLDALNPLADTNIKASTVTVRLADRANNWPLGALAHGFYLRSLKTIGADYDLRVTASGVVHWGLPAIHFISSAIWNDALFAKFGPPIAPRQYDGLRQLAKRLATTVSAASQRSLQNDLFVANSAWTACQSMPFCPNPIDVIYPAVPRVPSDPDWSERENSILVFGRISPEKHIETCIEIVERLRAEGLALKLCIAGPVGEAHYSAKIDALCAERASWIDRLDLVTGRSKQELLGRFRYGLSACTIEAFGIATAEMAAAGIVVMAPKAGGQGEILNDPRQLYGSVDDAVSRFKQLLDDPAIPLSLHANKGRVSERFDPENFVSQVQTIAAQFVAETCVSRRELSGP